MSSRSRIVVGTLALAVVAAALAAVGRWEHRHDVRRQVRGMERVASVVGPLGGRDLSGYRILPAMDCLTYRRGSNALALELCVDPAGRVVEAIDRRRPARRIFSLRFDRAESTLRVDRARVDALLHHMGAPS
jgi:hypothetical protein